jgi:hypothetical protein
MTSVGVPEKVLRRSQSIRCLENVRRVDEDLAKGVFVGAVDAQ